MDRHTRIQGIIIQDHKILLIRGYEIDSGQSFWVIPGGGLEAGESDEDCVIREMMEETGLEVQIEKFLVEEILPPKSMYKLLKSYLCIPIGGELNPGSEPEDNNFEITALRWFDLHDEEKWSAELRANPFAYPRLKEIRQILGYSISDNGNII